MSIMTLLLLFLLKMLQIMKDALFAELKDACRQVWKKYETRPWNYYEEKISKVNQAKPEDAKYLIRMFDNKNTTELWDRLWDYARQYYKEYF